MPNEQLIPILRKALLSEPLPANFAIADMNALSEAAYRHGIAPLVFDVMLEIGWGDETMKQVCYQNMLQQSVWSDTIAQAVRSLKKANLQPALLKGFGLATLYPKPYLRAWTDADIWVGVAQYHQACGVLRTTFPDAKHHDEEYEELKHYCFVFPDGKAIELHRVSMDFIAPDEQNYWQHLEVPALTAQQHCITIGDQQIALPEQPFNLLFVFAHAWEHFTSSGIPLKQLCDLMLLLNQILADNNGRIPKEYLAYWNRHLSRLHMLEIWRSIGYCVEQLSGKQGSWPLGIDERYGKYLWLRILQEGQGRVAHTNRYQLREQAKQMPVIKRKFITLHARFNAYRFLKTYAPVYARHLLAEEIKKGIRRTIRNERMIDY